MSDLVDRVLREWLESEMSRISRDTTGSDWMPGTEYVLWRAVCHLPRDYRCGVRTISAERLRRLGAVAEGLGGWIKRNPSGQKEFIPWDEWNEFFKKWLGMGCSDSQEDAETLGNVEYDGDLFRTAYLRCHKLLERVANEAYPVRIHSRETVPIPLEVWEDVVKEVRP